LEWAVADMVGYHGIGYVVRCEMTHGLFGIVSGSLVMMVVLGIIAYRLDGAFTWKEARNISWACGLFVANLSHYLIDFYVPWGIA
jgi:hypothetical protein